MWRLPETLREIGEDGDDGIVLELIDSFQSDTGSAVVTAWRSGSLRVFRGCLLTGAEQAG
jgi:hypothetical protein